MNIPLSNDVLRHQNKVFWNTNGVSHNNHSEGFRPAFCDTQSDRIELARYADGTPAPFHMLAGVPEEWVKRRNSCGRVTSLKSSVIAGFVRAGKFYTREQAARFYDHHLSSLAANE